MKILTEIEEAEELRRRFVELKANEGIGRAEFARKNKLKGGDAIIYQHINALRPISREAAIAYAKGFNCSLEEISPRLALEAMESKDLLQPTGEDRSLDLLAQPVFPLRCPECGKVSQKSFIELEMNDRLPCSHCTITFNINDQYGNGQLEAFIKAFGRSGFILRQNRKFD